MWTTQQMPDLTGKTIIVTGANTGIGYETALAFYQAGAHVVLACRNLASARHAQVAMHQTGGSGTLAVAHLDLASLRQVQQFADNFQHHHRQLHVLVNNAAAMVPPTASTTAEGYELQFGVNFLGPFALTGRLYPLLNATSGARVVTVSSLGYLDSRLDLTNLRLEKGYDGLREYRQSKLADLLFALELQRRIDATHGQVRSLAAQPGANRTAWAVDISPEYLAVAEVRWGGPPMEPWQGALPSLYAAVAPEAAGGKFYSPDQNGGFRGYPVEATIAPHALDEALASALWQVAEQATGVTFPVARPVEQA